MRAPLAMLLVLCLTGPAAPALAQGTDALRQELQELRRQLESTREQYQKTVDAMSERIRRLEQEMAAQPTPPAPAGPPVMPPSSGVGATSPAPTSAGLPPLLELARPREPFSLYERRGPGSLLFDIGIVADLVGNLAGDRAEETATGTFAGRENRFFPREVEVNLFGRIDPYAQGQVRFEFAEEFEDGERVLETKLAEAYLTLLTLPYGTQARLGLVPFRFGLLSHLHREALPQPDAPNVLLRFFGEEQVRESGLEVAWVAPLPFYLEALVGVFNGDNETAFGRGSLRSPLTLGRLRTFFELGDTAGLQVGLSAASGTTEDDRRQTFAGYDVKYKLTPEGWRHPLLTLASEGIVSWREAADPGEGSRRRFGWYAYGEVQPWKRWLGGIRYDSTEFLEASGREWAIEPYVAFLASDFLRFRLGFKHTERDGRGPFDGPMARTLDELFLQATFALGAHAPHPF